MQVKKKDQATIVEAKSDVLIDVVAHGLSRGRAAEVAELLLCLPLLQLNCFPVLGLLLRGHFRYVDLG